jgi:hypothetical protein
MENNEIASIIQKSGFASLYDNKSSYSKSNAQLNLEGRSYFATDSALKFFGARINSAHQSASGLLFFVVESSFLDMQKTKRGFRFHLFDIFGQEIGKQELSEAVKTSEQARKAGYKFIDQFDLTAHYAEKLESIAKKADKQASEAREICAQLTESEAVA